MKILATIICSFTVIFCAVAANPTMKPKLLVAADGFPKGHDTPEGAACDLARAFIKHDDALFTTTCIRLYGGGKARADYAAFLAKTVAEIKTEAARKEPSPGGPKSIGKVFAARHLSKDGPASYGYAAFGFQDVMFVDVGVFLQDGGHYLNRTLVIKDKDGKWYVHPIPSVSPLLSDGLNDEPPSKQAFSDAYDIQK
ncbi:MAG: hypothetical protein ACLQVA_12310 [Candidatus Brocadiia bacterium]